MRKEILISILETATGIFKEGNFYRVKSGHEVAFYLGEPGRAMVAEGVQQILPCSEYVEIGLKPSNKIYLCYEAIHAVSVKQEDEAKSNRSGVGF